MLLYIIHIESLDELCIPFHPTYFDPESTNQSLQI